MAKAAKKVVKKRRERKNIEKGCAHIQATFNNTMDRSESLCEAVDGSLYTAL